MTEQPELALFGVDVPSPSAPLSAGRRLTARQHADVAAGVHPLTREPTRPELGTCGGCALRVMRGRGKYPKCVRDGGVLVTAGVASDVRAWWPACPAFRPSAD